MKRGHVFICANKRRGRVAFGGWKGAGRSLSHYLHPSPQAPGLSTPLSGTALHVLWGCTACPCTQQPPVLCLLTGRQLSTSFYNPQ